MKSITVIFILVAVYFILSAGIGTQDTQSISPESGYIANYGRMIDCRDSGGDWTGSYCDYSRRIGNG